MGAAVGGKCTFGVRAPIEINMLNEVIYREVKHFNNYKTYRPSFGSTPLTSKFYAAHDQYKEESAEEAAKTEDYHQNVAQTRAKGPHSKYSTPVTENQCYGWYLTPIMKMDRNDKRLYHPRVESKNTKVEVIIKMSKPKKEKQ